MADPKFKPGCGVDVGTSNIAVARRCEDGSFHTQFHRDMLYPLDVSDESTDLLQRSDYLYIKTESKYYIIGEDALKLVNAIGRGEVVRPMQDGLLNPSLKEASELLFYVIKAVVGEPIVKNEPLRFSVPANPIDRDQDNIFHKTVLSSFFAKMGYDPKPVNEAMAICYDTNPVLKAKGEKDLPISGITCSCGGGMWNLCLAFKGLSLLEFSCTKSGDYVDDCVSKVTGLARSKVTVIKERKLNLEKIDDNDRVQVALSIYYDELIDRMVHLIAKYFKDKSSELEGELELVVAGGTSMVPGFIVRLETAIHKVDLPFKLYQVRHSATPFFSVAQGACIRAQADYVKTQKK